MMNKLYFRAIMRVGCGWRRRALSVVVEVCLGYGLGGTGMRHGLLMEWYGVRGQWVLYTLLQNEIRIHPFVFMSTIWPRIHR